jgi:hypothetical protein
MTNDECQYDAQTDPDGAPKYCKAPAVVRLWRQYVWTRLAHPLCERHWVRAQAMTDDLDMTVYTVERIGGTDVGST